MVAKTLEKQLQREARHIRIRKRITGTADRPRLCLARSLKNLSAQVVDDGTQQVIFGMSTLAKDFRGISPKGGNVASAAQFGELFGQAALKKGIKKVSFDRGGYLYHGRVKAFAEAARKAGLEF
ncbi:MAG: 50S ribosomal protein L18 [Candidatus Omnitrophica bacterium]|nr:50S ribosomal protein L18 [Candidatus Omnitrophota bacterium]